MAKSKGALLYWLISHLGAVSLVRYLFYDFYTMAATQSKISKNFLFIFWQLIYAK